MLMRVLLHDSRAWSMPCHAIQYNIKRKQIYTKKTRQRRTTPYHTHTLTHSHKIEKKGKRRRTRRKTNSALLPPPSPFRNSHTLECASTALSPASLHNAEAHKVPALPVAAVGTKHIEVLVLEGALALLEEPVNLTVVVEEIQTFLGEFFTAEVVGFEFDGAGESGDSGWRGDGAGGTVGGG